MRKYNRVFSVIITFMLLLTLISCGENRSTAESTDKTNDTMQKSDLDTQENNVTETPDISSKDNIANNVKEENKQVDDTKETLVNQDIAIDNIRTLSNESLGWGPGVNFDEYNRPTGALYYKELYSKYNADFIKDNKNEIYLTFDEGYENGYTSQILDVLKEKGIKATFFITKPYAESNYELVKRMIDEGHTVGSHSVTHPAAGMPSLSINDQIYEVKELHNYVKQKFDYDMYLFRYPAGIFSEQSLALVSSLGYTSVFWSFAYADWDPNNQPDEAEALKKVTDRLHNGAIYLLHAVSKTNADILGDFIDNAIKQGYNFKTY